MLSECSIYTNVDEGVAVAAAAADREAARREREKINFFIFQKEFSLLFQADPSCHIILPPSFSLSLH